MGRRKQTETAEKLLLLTLTDWNSGSLVPLEGSPFGGKSPGYTQCRADQCLCPGSGSMIRICCLRPVVSVFGGWRGTSGLDEVGFEGSRGQGRRSAMSDGSDHRSQVRGTLCKRDARFGTLHSALYCISQRLPMHPATIPLIRPPANQWSRSARATASTYSTYPHCQPAQTRSGPGLSNSVFQVQVQGPRRGAAGGTRGSGPCRPLWGARGRACGTQST